MHAANASFVFLSVSQDPTLHAVLQHSLHACWVLLILTVGSVALTGKWVLHAIVLAVSECGGQGDVICLFNGSSAMEGVVEYCLNSTWTPVCGRNTAACRQLGLAGGVHTVKKIERLTETYCSYSGCWQAKRQYM